MGSDYYETISNELVKTCSWIMSMDVDCSRRYLAQANEANNRAFVLFKWITLLVISDDGFCISQHNILLILSHYTVLFGFDWFYCRSALNLLFWLVCIALFSTFYWLKLFSFDFRCVNHNCWMEHSAQMQSTLENILQSLRALAIPVTDCSKKCIFLSQADIRASPAIRCSIVL